MATINFTLNGVAKSVTVTDTGTPLLWVLRDQLGLTGTKYGCGVEICGACTVVVDGQAEKACDMDIGEVAGRKVTTIEGLKNDPLGVALQNAWVQYQVPQCGFCQSGMLMAAYGSLKSGESKSSTAGSISNICQCGTFQRVKQAILSLTGVA